MTVVFLQAQFLLAVLPVELWPMSTVCGAAEQPAHDGRGVSSVCFHLQARVFDQGGNFQVTVIPLGVLLLHDTSAVDVSEGKRGLQVRCLPLAETAR